jgi:hypothetical protein
MLSYKAYNWLIRVWNSLTVVSDCGAGSDWGLGEYGGVAGQATHGKRGVMQEEKGTERTPITKINTAAVVGRHMF